MNKYVRQFFGVLFQSQQTKPAGLIQLQHAPGSPEAWRQHWQAKGFPWRTEPEIDAMRQEELRKCLAVVPDMTQGIYPFKGIKLTRADVEWLLAIQEERYVFIAGNGQSQSGQMGLDLRGANLSQVDLHDLPLTRLRGGLTPEEWRGGATEEQRHLAAMHLEGADLRWSHLERAGLRWAHLEGADLSWAYLEDASLRCAHLEKARLRWCILDHATFCGVHLQDADLRGSRLEGIDLRDAVLSNTDHVGPQVVDVDWGRVNLAVVKWSQVKMLGDEYQARQKRQGGKKKDKETQLTECEEAVRANRQLAVALQEQGLNEDAARFAYRAQVLQRKVLWKRRNFWKWSGSAILALLAGYGHRMWHIFVAYVIIVLLCAGAYYVLGMYYEPRLSFLDALLTSITAFHGRVFSEPFPHPNEPQLWVTAFEAVMGLVIEGIFIAMLTQKFFGK